MNLVFRFDPMTRDNAEYPAELFEGLSKIYDTLPEGFTVYTLGSFRPMSVDEFCASLQLSIQHMFHEVAMQWYEISIADEPISDKDWNKQIDDFKRPFDTLPSRARDILKKEMQYCKLAGDDFYNTIKFGEVIGKLPKSALAEIDKLLVTFREKVVHKPIMDEIDRVFTVLDKIRKRPDLG